MQISYKKLWKLLIDRDMLKKDLAAKAEISSTSVAKLSKNEKLLPEYPLDMNGMSRIQYVFESGLIITEKSMDELKELLG